MPFDIYGNTLQRGFCEVHPWINESYPCSLCFAENKKAKHEKDLNTQYMQEYEEYYAQQADEYYAQKEHSAQ